MSPSLKSYDCSLCHYQLASSGNTKLLVDPQQQNLISTWSYLKGKFAGYAFLDLFDEGSLEDTYNITLKEQESFSVFMWCGCKKNNEKQNSLLPKPPASDRQAIWFIYLYHFSPPLSESISFGNKGVSRLCQYLCHMTERLLITHIPLYLQEEQTAAKINGRLDGFMNIWVDLK